MNETPTANPPAWFWLIGGLAFFWNLIGMANFAMQMIMTDEMLASQPLELQKLIKDPVVNSAFGVAVVCGVIGCMGLLWKKKWALPFFVLSLVAAIAQAGLGFARTSILKNMVGTDFIIPVAVITVGCILIWYSGFCTRKKWLK